MYVPREPLPYSWVIARDVVSTIGEPSPKSQRYFVIAAPRADAALSDEVDAVGRAPCA